ncbi:calcium-binding protein [Chelatococcus sp. GCM10030263]|uniref:calcium-binding protein n=1 Tax=Chelatococcus sp. GCM10030263 TaxID=3273387 RepID=UPI00360C59A9
MTHGHRTRPQESAAHQRGPSKKLRIEVEAADDGVDEGDSTARSGASCVLSEPEGLPLEGLILQGRPEPTVLRAWMGPGRATPHLTDIEYLRVTAKAYGVPRTHDAGSPLPTAIYDASQSHGLMMVSVLAAETDIVLDHMPLGTTISLKCLARTTTIAFTQAAGPEDRADIFVTGKARLQLPDIEHLRLRTFRGSTIELDAPDVEILKIEGESARVVVQHPSVQLHEIDAHWVAGDFELLFTASHDFAVFGGGSKNNIVVPGTGMRLVATGNDDDVVRTGDGDDLIGVGAGDDRVEAGGGFNWITLGRGADRVIIADQGDSVASPHRGITTVTDFSMDDDDAIVFAFARPDRDMKAPHKHLIEEGSARSLEEVHRDALGASDSAAFWFHKDGDTYVGCGEALVRLLGQIELAESAINWVEH